MIVLCFVDKNVKINYWERICKILFYRCIIMCFLYNMCVVLWVCFSIFESANIRFFFQMIDFVNKKSTIIC